MSNYGYQPEPSKRNLPPPGEGIKIVSEAPKEGQFISIGYDSDGELVATTFRIEDGILLVLCENEFCEWGPANEFDFESVYHKFIIK